MNVYFVSLVAETDSVVNKLTWALPDGCVLWEKTYLYGLFINLFKLDNLR